jgi:flagellar biosynthesis/type III secretory pathway chaperone
MPHFQSLWEQIDCEKRAVRRAKASGIVVKEELDLKSPLLELWHQNQRTREPNLR